MLEATSRYENNYEIPDVRMPFDLHDWFESSLSTHQDDDTNKTSPSHQSICSTLMQMDLVCLLFIAEDTHTRQCLRTDND